MNAFEVEQVGLEIDDRQSEETHDYESKMEKWLEANAKYKIDTPVNANGKVGVITNVYLNEGITYTVWKVTKDGKLYKESPNSSFEVSEEEIELLEDEEMLAMILQQI